MKKWIVRFRPINLGIIALTQLFFAFIVLNPFLENEGITLFHEFTTWFIIIITIIVSAAGYIINDICDQQIDIVNKPSKAIQNLRHWNMVYKLLFSLGFILILVLSYYFKHPYFIAVYLLTWLLLYRYSTHLKCKPLIGNIIVSLFSASVILVLLAPYISPLKLINSDQLEQLVRPFSFYFIFAFFTSLIREIVKDMEDVTGDKKLGCNTLAVSAGIPRTKFLVQLIIISFLGFFWLWQFLYASIYPIWSLILLNIFICLPFVYFLVKINNASQSAHYRAVSTSIKWTMLAGISFLLLELYI